MTAHELAMSLRLAYLALHRRTDAVMAQAGITADQFVVLAALAEGMALTQSELGERIGSDRNTVRAMLVLLEGRGLIVRTPQPLDRRARRVALTPRGRRTFGTLWRKSDALRRELVTGLAPQQTATLVQLLRSLTATLTETSRTTSSRRSRRSPVTS